MKLYLAHSATSSHSELAEKLGPAPQLMSYWYLKGREDEMRRYITTGVSRLKYKRLRFRLEET